VGATAGVVPRPASDLMLGAPSQVHRLARAAFRPVYDSLLEGPAGRLFSEQVMVGPMDPVGLAEVITGPARRAGVILDDKVADTIRTEQTNGADALPLLSYLLHQLWQHAAGDGRITMEEYRGELAGHDNAIARHADEAAAAGPAALDALLQLVNHDGTSAYRRRVRVSELSGEQTAVLEHTCERRCAGRAG